MAETPSAAIPKTDSEAHPPAPRADLVGELLLDRFRVLEPLGEGGMALVYLAEHVKIHKRCAIKVLRPEHGTKPELVERFLQEARAASLIGHENVVEITDYGEGPNGCVFFVMELLTGEDLATTMEREGRMPWARVRPILLQICRALAAAHGRGVVHRDMKPENVFLTRRHGAPDFVKVLDFGIAKILGEAGGARSLTQTGVIIGTPQYMSPEQAQSETVDHRADIYSLGVIAYELLTGEVPFVADTYAKLITKHLFETPVAPSVVAPEAEIPASVEAIILKSLQKDRALRFQSMGELIRAIEDVGTGAPPVEVVAEHRVPPQTSGAAMSYAEAELAVAPGGAQAGGSRQGRVLLAAIVALVGVVVSLVLVLLLGSREGDEASAEAAPAVVAPADPEPPPAPPSPTVSVSLMTNVDAAIIDAVSGELLGRTNTAPGPTLERSETPRDLLLRAEGYEDLPLRLVPSDDVTSRHELVAIEVEPAVTKKTSRKKKNKKKDSDPFSLLPVDP